MSRAIAAWVVLLAALAGPVSAHPDHGEASGFMAGLLHPLTGLDHLLAMLAVGLWAGVAGGARLWAWPAAFMTGLVAGAASGWQGIAPSALEPAIAASLLVLGLVLAAGWRAPLAAGVAIVAAFGAAHGWAHGVEAPSDGSGLAYALGFVSASAGLHAVGLLIASRLAGERAIPVRFAGGAVALAAVLMIAAMA